MRTPPEALSHRIPARGALAAALGAAWLLAACGSTRAPVEVPSVPASFRHAGTASAAAQPAPREAWWRLFGDPVLEELEAAAARGNQSLQGAAARLARARALVRNAEAARSPQVALRAGVDRQGGPLVNAAGGVGTLVTALADLSYEVDLFGRLQQAADAATLDAQAQQALLADAQLLVQADVARTYLALRALDAERAIVRAAADAEGETAAITGRRFQTGSVAELEWVRAQTELAGIQADAAALDRRRAELENALAVLTGAPPPQFALAEARWDAPLPAVPAGLPAAVLARRPDVAAAQRNVQAAQARLGVAETAWLPNLVLTGSGGAASPNVGNLLAAAMRTWSVGALVGLAVVDGGRREAGVQAAGADLDTAVAAWREQVLVALREVEDQLAALDSLAVQAQAQDGAVALGERAVLLAESRYRSGLASQLDVLDARRTRLRHQRAALQVRSERYQATVRLVRALGGSWGDPVSPSGKNR